MLTTWIVIDADTGVDDSLAILYALRSPDFHVEGLMAAFLEGGSGANVVYVEGNDNRGAGSSIGWQMRGLPDGTRIRVRVI